MTYGDIRMYYKIVTIQSWDRKLTNQENTKSLQKVYTHSANLSEAPTPVAA